jgi:tetratricopeptide (TPR) repeat protein
MTEWGVGLKSLTPVPRKLEKPVSKIILKTLVVATSLLFANGAYAVDNVISKDAPDLASPRAKIKAKDFKAAIDELTPMLATNQHADIYNLMGFSLRKSGDVKQAATFYAKALDFDPNHKGALEYQGEMFVELGQIDKAKVNLARLVTLCPQGCEEREDLAQAIVKASASPKTN